MKFNEWNTFTYEMENVKKEKLLEKWMLLK